VEDAGSADPDSIKNAERIYRDAYATARRRGLFDQLGRELLAVRQEATEVAKVAAGEEALAAHRRFEAVFNGRGVLADPADAPAVGRYLGFMDAAKNAVSTAALRPHISRQDFAHLWRGYATVLDFTRGKVDSPTDAKAPHGEPLVPAAPLTPTADSASPTTWTAPERELAALGYPQVGRFVHALGRLAPGALLTLEGSVAGDPNEQGAAAVLEAGRGRHEQAGLWPLTIRAVKQQPVLASASQHFQAAVVVAGVALGVKWDVAPETWNSAWGPFGETIPYTSVWAANSSEPPEFQSPVAVEALARERLRLADLFSHPVE
jgi:hypothetical protein